jgi:hypothetical protein
MHGQCLKCKTYGLVEKHHPLPRRWWGSNSWTEPLCRRCHQRADNLTLDIDADFGVIEPREGQKLKDVFIEVFVTFMNA